MALALLEQSDLFAERVAACARALDPHLGYAVEDVLRGVEGTPSLKRPAVVQPALFAVMVALARCGGTAG